jgi:hypothetical protein
LLPFPPSRLFFSTAFNIVNTFLSLKRKEGKEEELKGVKVGIPFAY